MPQAQKWNDADKQRPQLSHTHTHTNTHTNTYTHMQSVAAVYQHLQQWQCSKRKRAICQKPQENPWQSSSICISCAAEHKVHVNTHTVTHSHTHTHVSRGRATASRVPRVVWRMCVRLARHYAYARLGVRFRLTPEKRKNADKTDRRTGREAERRTDR